MSLLTVKDLGISFGGLKALSDFNLEMEPGELVGLIGPNGAGKTTVFNLLTGVYQPTEGQIDFAGKSLVGQTPYQITQKGLARTFQNIRLFGEQTVLDNVKNALHWHKSYNLPTAFLHLPGYFAGEDAMNREALELLEVLGMADKQGELAKNLPYGQQRRLEICRALATGAKLLLLDEPAAGMNPQETRDLMALIRQLKDKFQLTILLIEHDMSLVMGICERIYVLDYGKTLAVGTPAEIQNNPEVIKAYLGEVAENA